jgi:hypothetical protein
MLVPLSISSSRLSHQSPYHFTTPTAAVPGKKMKTLTLHLPVSLGFINWQFSLDSQISNESNKLIDFQFVQNFSVLYR